ncbi:hypothetical protein glysoja_046718 [Glycine soja]|uniref:Uncharacterized protein n=1 Tax=Glycine soja TaxID=3848 RepID=A0A0B2Q0C7_GLYSO|nr:hypothetical protein glysoja_046718 [Glycine soja]
MSSSAPLNLQLLRELVFITTTARLSKVYGIFAVKTSQIPSLPIMKNSSSFVNVINLSLCSTLNGPPFPLISFIPWRFQLPSA